MASMSVSKDTWQLPGHSVYRTTAVVRAKGSFAAVQIKVVNRELVAVLTQATLTDAEMLQAQPDAAYLLSITEQQIAKAEPGQEEYGTQQGLNGKSVRIGICAVDVATARILLGQW